MPDIKSIQAVKPEDITSPFGESSWMREVFNMAWEALQQKDGFDKTKVKYYEIAVTARMEE